MDKKTHSTDGREWAKLSDLKAGDLLEFDTTFTCGIGGKTLLALQDHRGEWYVRCRHGTHFLEAQTEDGDGDHMIGVWPAAAVPA